MRAILLLVIVVVVLALLGWITFGNSEKATTLNIEKEAIRQDIEELKEAGEKVGDRIEQQIDGAGGDAPSSDQD